MDGDRRWPLRHGLIVLALVFFVGYGFVFLRDDRTSDWQNVFVRAALRLQAHEPIHRPGDNYAYPPAMAMLSVPLANLPAAWSLLAWYLVNVAATAAVVTCAWRLAGGPSLVGLGGRWAVILGIGIVLAGRFLVAPLENRQFDMVIAALLFAGVGQVWKGRELAGAACLGAAAAMKCTPLLFGPYLLWRGRVKAALGLGAVAVALNVLPDLLWPQASGRLYLADWARLYLGEVGRAAPGQWFSDILLNQSLAGLFNRFLSFGLPLSVERLSEAAPPGGATGILRVLVYGSGCLLLAVTACVFGRPGTAAPTLDAEDPVPVPWAKLRIGMESAGVVCLMLLLSPMSSKAHYIVLVLPSFILARLAVERRPPWLPGILAVLLITGPLTAKGLIGRALGSLTLAWGLPTWFALVSLVGIWGALRAVRPGYR